MTSSNINETSCHPANSAHVNLYLNFKTCEGIVRHNVVWVVKCQMMDVSVTLQSVFYYILVLLHWLMIFRRLIGTPLCGRMNASNEELSDLDTSSVGYTLYIIGFYSSILLLTPVADFLKKSSDTSQYLLLHAYSLFNNFWCPIPIPL